MASRRGYLHDSVRSCTAPELNWTHLHLGNVEKGVEQHIVVENLSPAEITTKFSQLLSL